MKSPLNRDVYSRAEPPAALQDAQAEPGPRCGRETHLQLSPLKRCDA